MEKLTEQEINDLIDALTAWEDKDFGSFVMSSLLEVMLSDKGSEESREKMKKERLIQQQKEESLKRLRKEQSILIKVKLIKMRSELTKDSIPSHA
jgi:ABC-type uncharacterized transport system involved in gliding motility auxiliary subunit